MIFPLFVASIILAMVSFFFSPNPEKKKVKQVVHTEKQRKTKMIDTLDF